MVALVCLIMLVTGILFWIVALKNRSERAPDMTKLPTYSPRNWKPVCYQREWFTRKEYRFYVGGTILIVASGLIGAFFVYG